MTDPPLPPADEHSQFEAELRQFRPAPSSPVLRERIAASLEITVSSRGLLSAGTLSHVAASRADRFLLGYMSVAAAAAVLIVTLLVPDFYQRPMSVASERLAGSSSAAPTSLAQTRELLAQLAQGQDPFITSNSFSHDSPATGGTR